MEPDVRAPKKGAGVPPEQRGGTLVADLAATLAPVLAPGRDAALVELVESRGFYERGLTAQRELLEQAVIAVCDRPGQAAAALGALEAAQREPVRRLAPGVAFRLYHVNPDLCLPALRRTGSLPGAWPQEAAQGCLKRLMIEHGVAPILARATRGPRRCWAWRPRPNWQPTGWARCRRRSASTR